MMLADVETTSAHAGLTKLKKVAGLSWATALTTSGGAFTGSGVAGWHSEMSAAQASNNLEEGSNDNKKSMLTHVKETRAVFHALQ